MCKLAEVNPSVNSPSYVPIPENSCNDNYAPLYILVVVLFIGLLLAPTMAIIDKLVLLHLLKPLRMHLLGPQHLILLDQL
ncbi:unnamed protein product [Blepharisma stoltei]|uniref:Uncharacterized protein n=1 Tax=Blepharisma stoltei TaxID=1481888 RepID=A0AAU9J7J3_9CILI|nr:unnamed protein product [Blepharisma stoltei]